MIKNNTTELQEILSKVQSLPRSQILQDNKNITPTKETQVILPDGGYDGLTKVTIQGDENLLAENIKEGINIFGVIGTLKVANTASLLSLDEEEVKKCNVNFIFNNVYSDTLIYFYYLDNQEIIFNPQNISTDSNSIVISNNINSLIFIIGEALTLQESELPCYYVGQNNELYNMYLVGAINEGTIIFQKGF